jgi:hypothetical protein
MTVNLVELKIAPKYLWAAGIIWPPIVVAILVARFATRYSQRSRFGLDDWLTLPALVSIRSSQRDTTTKMRQVLILGVGANLLIGVKTKALGYPTPIPAPGTALTSTSREQTIARKVNPSKSALYQLDILSLLGLLDLHGPRHPGTDVAQTVVHALLRADFPHCFGSQGQHLHPHHQYPHHHLGAWVLDKFPVSL